MSKNENTALELLFSNMVFLEQFVESVTNYTSKYNSVLSILYAPENLIGKPAKYPMYGDFPDTYVLRSYGKWWNQSKSAQSHYMPQDIDPIASEDFVTVRFEYPVIPHSVSIYETYNPGAVVKLWGKTILGTWILLWEKPPERCIQTSRKFSPEIRLITELINEIRIDLNQSLLEYHTSLDAVLLAGYKPKSMLQSSLLQKRLLDPCISCNNNKSIHPETCYLEKQDDLFSALPYEVMIHIFQYLDLRSLCRSAQVNKRWHLISLDPALYREISLKRYWHKIDDTTLKYFMTRSKNMKKLDLSWCGINKRISEDYFIEFIEEYGKNLTHLSLGQCNFIKNNSLEKISYCNYLTDLRLRNCQSILIQFSALANLTKLTALDLYSTAIVDEALIKILMSNPDLKHLIIDFCEFLKKLDQIAETVATYNRKLNSWSSWKTHSLSSEGVAYLARCSHLIELDVGWCFILNEPGDCLERIALGCKDLRRLIISGWRGVSDHLLLPIIRSCKQLTQLDLLGIKNISGDICERILDSLLKLELLDISFCDAIKQEQVTMWKKQYPNVLIQRSCSS